jgi:hypothetical protein
VLLDVNPLIAMTEAKVSNNTIVLCYRTTAVTSVQCRAASVLASIGAGVTLGPVLTVQDSTDYSAGEVSGIVDVTDRVVLTFSAGIASPSSRLVVLGVAPAPSLALTALTAGSLAAYEISAATDNIALVSLTRLVQILVYRVRAVTVLLCTLAGGCRPRASAV